MIDRPAEQTKIKGVSLTDWTEAYERQPIEVIDGEIIIMHPPTRGHALTSRYLYDSIKGYLTTNPMGEVFQDNVPYILDGDDRKDWVTGSVVPDVSFISQARFDEHEALYADDDGPFRLAPDLAIEIVSPNDKYTDVNRKIGEYLKYGTQMVIVIDAKLRTIRVCTSDQPNGIVLSENDTLHGEPVLPGFQIPVRDILDRRK